MYGLKLVPFRSEVQSGLAEILLFGLLFEGDLAAGAVAGYEDFCF